MKMIAVQSLSSRQTDALRPGEPLEFKNSLLRRHRSTTELLPDLKEVLGVGGKVGRAA